MSAQLSFSRYTEDSCVALPSLARFPLYSGPRRLWGSDLFVHYTVFSWFSSNFSATGVGHLFLCFYLVIFVVLLPCPPPHGLLFATGWGAWAVSQWWALWDDTANVSPSGAIGGFTLIPFTLRDGVGDNVLSSTKGTSMWDFLGSFPNEQILVGYDLPYNLIRLLVRCFLSALYFYYTSVTTECFLGCWVC